MSLRSIAVGVVLAGTFSFVARPGGAGPAGRGNLFANPSFELGKANWRVDKGGSTVASFTVDAADAADERYSAIVTLGKVEEWGAQFGQTFPAGARGKTYTFAVLAKSVGAPVTVDLQIERSGKPYDRAARSGRFALKADKWTELHVTFKVDKDFRQGWFAYVSCTQANCRYRADMFRLYEGPYVPYAKAARPKPPSAAVRTFDTVTSSQASWPAEGVAKRRGWTPLAEKSAKYEFKGDAALVNDRLAVVVRQAGPGAEVYSLAGGAPTLRARLAPLAASGTAKGWSVRLHERSADAVTVEATGKTSGGKPCAVRYVLKTGRPIVGTQAVGGVEAMRVDAPCRFAVMPDFFADDIVLDAAELGVARAEIPTDNFLLHLLGAGEAIVANVWKSPEKDVRISLVGKGERRTIAACEIPYGKAGRIWTAVLAAPGIWHVRNVTDRDRGRAIALGWRAPFAAQWRVDWRRHDGLTDSWEMITENPRGGYTKYGWFGGASRLPANRRRWTTVLGRFEYPCWIDRHGRGHLQPLKRVLRFGGPAVLYPINRTRDTPLARKTIVDLMRETLGVGPCQHVLDVEGQQSVYKGRATCSTRDTLEPIYARGQQKQQRARIEKVLQEVLVFIRHIRGRIEQYVAFGREMRHYLDAQRKAHPDLAQPLDELERLTRAIDTAVARRRDKIKTPEQAAKMVDEFRRTLLDYEGADALAKCKKFTRAWVVIGGNQDELAGECRWAVRVLRQRAGLLTAVEPRLAEVAKEIRRRTHEVLRNPAGHEASRH